MSGKVVAFIKSSRFKYALLSTFLCVALIGVFRIPARLISYQINRNSNLPVGVLERSKNADWSDFELLPGFGMVTYRLSNGEGISLRLDVSRWPDALWGQGRVDYVACTDPNYSIFGFSVGDKLSDAEAILRKRGFIVTEEVGKRGFRCRKFGVIISCWADEWTGKIKEITISVPSSSIIPIVY